jgi:hypothetical protein
LASVFKSLTMYVVSVPEYTGLASLSASALTFTQKKSETG